MKTLFHLIKHLMNVDKFKLLTEILFLKALLISIHSDGERNTLHLCTHNTWKKSSDKILTSSYGFASNWTVLYW